MNNTETLKILAVLKGAYPSFYRDMKRTEADGVVSLWTEMFADEPYELVVAAVKALLAADEKGFPPHIGAVKARIRQITQPQSMTEGEAWALIHRAIKKSAYGSQEEFDRLPPELQRLAGAPSQLREWSQMDPDTVQSVVASNVQRSYREVARQNREYAALPGDVKSLVQSVGGGMALGAGAEQ